MTIAKVQEGLAEKAKRNPSHRFEKLMSLVASEKWLTVAAYAVLENAGANTPGIDGVRKHDVKPTVLASELAQELKNGTYAPSPVRRVYVPKPNGKQRPLGIPTLRDRVVQEALRMVLEPIMESHFLDCSTGFRPGRRTMDAIHQATYFTSNQVKMWWVVEGDIKGCFDNIPHSKLMGVLKQYVKDPRVLALVKSFLSAGIAERGVVTRPNCGVPQGGVVSPLLANVYLHEVDKYWHKTYASLTAKQKEYRRVKGLGNVRLVRYADDFLLLTNGNKSFAQEVMEEFTKVFEDLGLELSKEKTLLTHLNDGLDFLGFHLQRVHSTMAGKSICLVTPSEANVQKFKDRLKSVTSRDSIGDDPINKFRAVNALINGWGNYYRHGNVRDVFDVLDEYVHERVYRWLKAKHSNVSAHGSIAKHVYRRYHRRGRSGVMTWAFHGAEVKNLAGIKREKYFISWPPTGNPYIGETAHTLTPAKEALPVPEPGAFWTGSSGQSAYAAARAERLVLVGYKCEDCGGTKGDLHSHHVVARKDGGANTVENLRILCFDCHKETPSYGRSKRTFSPDR